jgi:hypothetical protein
MLYLGYNHIRFITILLLSMFLFVNCKQKEPDQEDEPVGLISINDRDASTDSNIVELSLASFDKVGVVGYYVSESNSDSEITEWAEVESTTSYYKTVPFSLSSGLGDKTVYAWFKNENGVVSAVTSDDIKLVPFSGSVTINAGDSSTDSLLVKVQLISDVGTSYYISESPELPTDNIDWVTMDTLASITFTFGVGSGTKTIYAWFKNDNDIVSLVASDSIEAVLPIPSSSIRINGGDSSTSSDTVQLTIASDDTAGVVAYFLSETDATPDINAPAWVTVDSTPSYSGTVPLTFSNSDLGTKEVYVWFKNAVGVISDVASGSIVKESAVVVQGNLYWQKETAGKKSWSAADAHCSNLELEGHTNWRLPTEEELIGLGSNSGVKTYNSESDNIYYYWAWSSTDFRRDGLAQTVAFKKNDVLVQNGRVVKKFGSLSTPYHFRCVLTK